MDWFLYDSGLRLERVKLYVEAVSLRLIKVTGKNGETEVSINNQ